MLSAAGVPAAPALPAAPGASLGAGRVDSKCSLVGLAPRSRAVCERAWWLQGSTVGCGEHPEMGMFTVEITWSEHLRGDGTTLIIHTEPSAVHLAYLGSIWSQVSWDEVVKHQTQAEYPHGYICLRALLLCIPVGVKEMGGFYSTEKKYVVFLSFESLFLGKNCLFFSVTRSLKTTFFPNIFFNTKPFLKIQFFKHFHLPKNPLKFLSTAKKYFFSVKHS